MTLMGSPKMGARRLDRAVGFTPADFAQIAGLLHDLTGIRLTEANDRMVYARLVTRVVHLGFSTFSEYLERALYAGSREELDFFISALTTNTTHFFREAHHFDFLAETVLPELIERARAGARVRLWSAGCSTGEEPYSIALCVLERFPDAAAHDLKILATDIDRTALAKAEAARYSAAGLRALSPERLREGFEGIGPAEAFAVRPAVKALITFRQLNLIEPWPFSGKFDAIFCRNVAIYMEPDTQTLIWNGFRAALRAGGHLFIGHSERLPPALLHSFTLVGKTTYKLDAHPH